MFHVRMILIQTTVEMEAKKEKNKKFINTLYIVWLALCVVFMEQLPYEGEIKDGERLQITFG